MENDLGNGAEVGGLLARICDDVVIRITSQASHECVSEISYLRTVGSSVMDYMKGAAGPRLFVRESK
jgi:hypothetical protein